MKYSEIGSEFWEYHTGVSQGKHVPDWLKWGRDNRFFLSGRTALDHIIKDVKSYSAPKTAYLPSYCCQTMIKPFEINGLLVRFYDVIVDSNGRIKLNVDFNFRPDIFVAINYFGFETIGNEEIIRFYKDHNSIIIEDSTQSLFNKNPFNPLSDYVFSGFRKWTAIFDGAIATRISDFFLISDVSSENIGYLSYRKNAMFQKHQYINGIAHEKENFLKVFATADEILKNDFIGYSMSEESHQILNNLDVEEIVKLRSRNAEILINGLLEIPEVRLPFTNPVPGNCPLFVPILLADGMRDNLKNYLIKSKIYLPVHWPVSDSHILRKETEYIFRNELSVVCDQRYPEDEMDMILWHINNFFSL